MSCLGSLYFTFIEIAQLSAITPDILGIVKNKEILAINQDDVVGKSISPFRWGINVGLAINRSL
jgi:alpha-galactosidase